jgi:hypothetical protein
MSGDRGRGGSSGYQPFELALLTKEEVEGVAVSTERLDRSEEALDLKIAVWAGFIKSRFWRTAGRIEFHAVVGRVIFWATLLFSGLLIYMSCVQKRFPNPTTLNVFCATIGLPSFYYAVQQNRELLRRFWENPWGKLAYGLLASVIVTGCKVMADQQIRFMTQSNPSLFPSAQQAITVLSIIVVTPVLIGGFMFFIAMAQVCKLYVTGYGRVFLSMLDKLFLIREMLGLPSQPQPLRSEAFSMTRLFAYTWGGTFIMLTLLFFTSIAPNRAEVLLLRSSFIPNDLGLAGSDRVCINLPSDTLVSPFSTRDPIPNQVVMAQPISTGPDRLGRSYTYQVVACSKPIDPGALSSARTDISPDQKSGDPSTGSSHFVERPAMVPKTQRAVNSRNRRLEN